MATSIFTKKLIDTAQQQYQLYNSMDEADDKLSKQIRKYYDDLGFNFISSVTEPWSAVFISWCIFKAGANATEFKFSLAHSKFVHKAIQNTIQDTGVFKGRRLQEYHPKIGDIIQNNRGNSEFDYNYARDHSSYQSHSAIVIEVGEDHKGKYLLTIGGNESDSVRMKEIRLDVGGFIKQRNINPYISIIENLK
jgi:hypothetical protein